MRTANRLRRLWLVLFLVTLAGCIVAESEKETASDEVAGEPVMLTMQDTGRRIEIRSGELMEIRLDENPTTGFRWAKDEADEAIVVLKSSTFVLPEDPLVGQGGVRAFTYEAVGVGEAQVKLKHWQEWEGEASTIERFEITVTVKK